MKRDRKDLVREPANEEPTGSRVATADDLAGYGFVGSGDEADSDDSPPPAGPRGRNTNRLEGALADEPLIAVFVDYENLALGVGGASKGQFRIDLVLRRLLEKGRIVFKRAYCDWGRYRNAVREFHSHGIELIDIPQSKASGKNSADIRMVVDALDLCYQKTHIDIFALLSGDSDFSPLAAKLKENEKRVIGCGVKSSTSDLLIGSCDEFLYYDDLVRVAARTKPAKPKTARTATLKRDEASEKVIEIVRSLERDYDTVWGSMVKQAMRRVFPGFNEEYFGHTSFAELLEDVKKQGLVSLDFDEKRGNYIVRSRRSK